MLCSLTGPSGSLMKMKHICIIKYMGGAVAADSEVLSLAGFCGCWPWWLMRIGSEMFRKGKEVPCVFHPAALPTVVLERKEASLARGITKLNLMLSSKKMRKNWRFQGVLGWPADP